MIDFCGFIDFSWFLFYFFSTAFESFNVIFNDSYIVPTLNDKYEYFEQVLLKLQG